MKREPRNAKRQTRGRKPAHATANDKRSLWIGAAVSWRSDGTLYTGTVESWRGRFAAVRVSSRVSPDGDHKPYTRLTRKIVETKVIEAQNLAPNNGESK